MFLQVQSRGQPVLVNFDKVTSILRGADGNAVLVFETLEDIVTDIGYDTLNDVMTKAGIALWFMAVPAQQVKQAAPKKSLHAVPTAAAPADEPQAAPEA